MSTHPEEALPAHSANIAAADGTFDLTATLTVGGLRLSLRDLPADTPVLINVDATDPHRAALYAHQGANGRYLIIAAGPAALPRQER